MYKSILVPLDGSARAERILPHVEPLAQRFEARLILLRVIEPAGSLPPPEQPDFIQRSLEAEREQAQSYLKAKAGELRTRGLETQSQVLVGSAATTICSVADSEEVDLIAMASHGRGGLARVFYGSVTAAVLNQVDRPLLLVRARRRRRS